ncbi:MAG: sigma-70 family RNA polymerase sigma factor [Balneolaceae bacterium]|nr:sigma-70 family RNA polymerase sigma factor [Balneolaceae bacterium]MCH8549241.1 sigma-70 family RNA polymerase sigma factor [Balneolaceae bacterium]
MGSPEDVTRLLNNIKKDDSVYDQIYDLVYDELKQMAEYRIRLESPDHTFSRTELVHETYLKMVRQSDTDFNNRSHFLAIASNCMRQILIDHARRKNAVKRGGDQDKMTYVDGLFSKNKEMIQELIDLDDALERLSKLNPRLTEVVTMRFFGGMKVEEVAEALDISESTVHRDWLKARGWLHKELKM